MKASMTFLEVHKSRLNQTRIAQENAPALKDGQLLLQVDLLSLTANNITYAVLGEQMGYWQFFSKDDDYGRVPAWGFASVVESAHPEIKPGQRYYGYFPIGSHLVVDADRVKAYGFVDVAAQRRGLPGGYNYYSSTSHDPMYTQDTEAFQSVFRPLFTTSFLLEYFLTEKSFFDADNIIISSASSKTAKALAFLLHESGGNVQLTALTSSSNTSTVSSWDLYDKVLGYDDMDQLNLSDSHVIVDFAGNHQLQYRLQTHLGDQLQYNCRVGITDWSSLSGSETLANQGEFFFAPSYAKALQKEIGVGGFQSKLAASWAQFIAAYNPDIQLVYARTWDEVQAEYLMTLGGKIDPSLSRIIQPAS